MTTLRRRYVAARSIKVENEKQQAAAIMTSAETAQETLNVLHRFAVIHWPESNSRFENFAWSGRFHIADLDFDYSNREGISWRATIEKNNTVDGVYLMVQITNMRDVMRIHSLLSSREIFSTKFRLQMLHDRERDPSDPDINNALISTDATSEYPCHIDDNTLSIKFPPKQPKEMMLIMDAIRTTARTRYTLIFPRAPRGTLRATRNLFPP